MDRTFQLPALVYVNLLFKPFRNLRWMSTRKKKVIWCVLYLSVNQWGRSGYRLVFSFFFFGRCWHGHFFVNEADSACRDVDRRITNKVSFHLFTLSTQLLALLLSMRGNGNCNNKTWKVTFNKAITPDRITRPELHDPHRISAQTIDGACSP